MAAKLTGVPNCSEAESDNTSAAGFAGHLGASENTNETIVLQPEESNAQRPSAGVGVCQNDEPDRWQTAIVSPKPLLCSIAADTDGQETVCPGRKNVAEVPFTQPSFTKKTFSSGIWRKTVLPSNESNNQKKAAQFQGSPISFRNAEAPSSVPLSSCEGCPSAYVGRLAQPSSAYLFAGGATKQPDNSIAWLQTGDEQAVTHESGSTGSVPEMQTADFPQMPSNPGTQCGAESVVRRGDTTKQESSAEARRALSIQFQGRDTGVRHVMRESPGGASRLSLTENRGISSNVDRRGIPSCLPDTYNNRAELRQDCCSLFVERPYDGGDPPQSFFIYGHRLFSNTPSTSECISTVSHHNVGKNFLPSSSCSYSAPCNTNGCSYSKRENAKAPSSHRNTEAGAGQQHRIWLRRIRGTPFSVCENCGTPFDTRPQVDGRSVSHSGNCGRDPSRAGEDMHRQPTKGSNEQEHEHEKQPDSKRGISSPLADLCSALGEGTDSQGLTPVQDRDTNTCSRESCTSTRSSADTLVEHIDGLAANTPSDTERSGKRKRSVSEVGSRCDLSGTGASSFEEVRTTSAASASNTNTCLLPLGERTSEAQKGPVSGCCLINSRRPTVEKRGCLQSSYTCRRDRRKCPFHGSSARSDSDDDDDGSPPCRCYSLHRTESLFPTSKENSNDGGDSHRIAKDLGSNGEDGMCSCSSALESLKGVTWGWGFQSSPKASLNYYFGELKSGLAVPMSQLPATMTCAIIANVPVAAALHGAWITGLITAVFGGSPLSVTTVTSSLAVTLAKVTRTKCDEVTNVCHEEGLEFIFPALVLAGFCCFLLGLLRLSRFSQFVPSATIVGYLNAVAILNVRAQVETFRFDPVTSTGYEWIWVLLMIIVVFGVMCCWEKIPHIMLNRFIPSSVLAIALSSFIEFVFVRRIAHMQTKTVASLSSMTEGDIWPKPFFLTPENIKPLSFYLQPSNLLTMLELTLALVMVNYISTLITVDMMSDKVGTMRSEPDQHLVSVGAANTVACFLGALPGSTAPSPSLLNLKVGGKGRESSVFCALVNLALVAASTYLLDYVPLGGLAGIIMYTAYHAFQWSAVAAMFASFLPARLRQKHSFLQRKICRSDAFVMLLTTIIAISADIGTAILSGVCISACVFAWKNGSRLSITSRVDPESGIKYYRVKGPIFFLTKRKLLRSFDIERDPPSVVFELTGDACQLFDFGAMETLDTIVARYRKKNKRVRVVGMQRGDKKMIVKAGRMFEFAQIDIVERAIDEGDGPNTIPPIADMMKLPC
ncbi:inorganic anion transporter, sulfate permease (SulP) family protein [Toxoplasma gondii MAS]|uniref:Inorganic anion transporter, sulfate permease (SulP) family protein n=1 Tax=Toxoplasma gondii MAS TaxID=943118 RepID=A0A086PTN8_TOXGO|nr:inorganic anion transporter, sulfate permease (SulP) family protein [Toxoplasma gondii MAS]